jgi:hypothetical protein
MYLILTMAHKKNSNIFLYNNKTHVLNRKSVKYIRRRKKMFVYLMDPKVK